MARSRAFGEEADSTLTFPDARSNLILSALPPSDIARIRPSLEPYRLRPRQFLQEPGLSSEYVYFPVSGLISVLVVLKDRAMVEFAAIGREGATGALLSSTTQPEAALISQIPGTALRMRHTAFAEELRRSHSLSDAVAEYRAQLLALAAQSAACNCLHRVEQRCARWLLRTNDHTTYADEFPVTQEFLAQLLGVSRPRVALATEHLQRTGLISYHRGRLRVVDRSGLEAAACECYTVMRTLARGHVAPGGSDTRAGGGASRPPG